jgi:rare lipoprotein A
MEIKPATGSVNDIRKTRVQNPVPQGAKTFSAELRASMAQKAAAASPVGAGPVEYTVKKGDNLWNIGRNIFKVDPGQIARDNGLSNPDMLKVGQKLIINPPAAQTIQRAQPRAGALVTASWYGAGHHNRKTASGARFNMYQNTLAHRTMPMGTRVRLVNPDNGKIAVGVVNDRGPYIKGRDVDVSYAMAKQLGFIKKGVTKLNIEKI